MAVRSVVHIERITRDSHGKYIIEGHRGLKGLVFADRKHAEAFLIRVRRMETDLERALRDAVLAER